MAKYAKFDHTATAPQPVIGWFDTDAFTYATLPPVADLLTLTQAQWDARLSTPFVSGSTLISAPPSQLLASAKTSQIGTLTDAYNAAIEVSVSYMATTFQADFDSVAKIIQVLAAMTPAGATPTGFYWVDANNAKVLMTLAQVQGLAQAIMNQGWTAFQNLQTKKASVNAATTVSAVSAVVW